MVLTNVLSPLHFSSVLLTRASLKESQNLWPNSHVLQSFHYMVAVFGTHFLHQFSVSKSANRHKFHLSAAEMLWRNQPIIANNPSKGGANATLHCTGPSAIQNLPIRIHPATKIRHADQKLTQVFRFQQTGSLPVSLAYPKVAHPHSPWQWLLSPMTTTPKPPRWASLKFNAPKTETGETIWG